MQTLNNEDGWPPKFTLNQERILHLLTGDRFYSDASAALRESILNAIDAISRLKRIDASIEQSIHVVLDQEKLTYSVSDNGTGMSRDQIVSLFASIGSSMSVIENDSKAVGEFGIGVVSYFMAGDYFEVHTYDGLSAPIGLSFKKKMLSGGVAEEITPKRNERGTTIEIKLRGKEIFDLLLGKFSHWCRDVDGLVALCQPSGDTLRQGSTNRTAKGLDLELPDWIEASHLYPVSRPTGWDSMSADSKISILYRGIFVQDISIRGPWGIEGSIDVDPKHFQPRLNRESFVETKLQTEIESFLKKIHPLILEEMALLLEEYLNSGALDSWTVKRWATLWLSVPRDSSYAASAQRWDALFRNVPAFEIAEGIKWRPLTLNDLVGLGSPVYVAPHPDDNSNDVVKAAVRLLRHTGKHTIRGLTRDNTWLRHAGNYFSTTADLIGKVFASELPELVHIAANPESILSSSIALATLYAGDPVVELVRYGKETPPILRIGKKLIVNIEHPAGLAIAKEVLAINTGRWALVEATVRHAQDQITQVSAAIRNHPKSPEMLGLVKRRFLKGFLE